jgi:hypothetical protein
MTIKNLSKLGLAALALSVIMTSCKKLDSLVKVNVGLQMAQVPFTINPTGAGTTTETATVNFDVDSAINSNNASYGVANIKSAQVDSVVITLTNATFAGVTNTSASFYSDAVATPVTIATNANGSATSSLTLVPSSTVDLTNYVKATSFTYSFVSTHSEPILNPISANAIVYFHVVVSPN